MNDDSPVQSYPSGSSFSGRVRILKHCWASIGQDARAKSRFSVSDSVFVQYFLLIYLYHKVQDISLYNSAFS